MELEIKQQAICLLWGLVFGLALGLMYRLLRLCRKMMKKQWPFDALFALSCFLTAFIYGMKWAEGRLGLWEITALSTGFYLYTAVSARLFSETFRRLKNF